MKKELEKKEFDILIEQVLSGDEIILPDSLRMTEGIRKIYRGDSKIIIEAEIEPRDIVDLLEKLAAYKVNNSPVLQRHIIKQYQLNSFDQFKQSMRSIFNGINKRSATKENI
jgi:hypothetical protein